MRTRSLILLVLLVTLSGCVTYRDFPIVNPLPSPYEPAAPPRCRQTVERLGGLAYQSAWELRLSVALQEALKNYGGCSNSSPVDYTSKGAETEVKVSVVGKKSDAGYEYYLVGGFIVSGGFIPIYSGQGGVELFYSVYDRNALKKMYRYEITRKEFVSLLLLPFFWINFFTYSLEDAVRSTTAQFVVDTQRDGFLGTAE
jgi:hypothetical protein